MARKADVGHKNRQGKQSKMQVFTSKLLHLGLKFPPPPISKV